jgi:hypothetical protein
MRTATKAIGGGRHRRARIALPIREGRVLGNFELRSAFVTMVKTTDTRPRYNLPSPCVAHSPFRSLLLKPQWVGSRE